MKIIEHSHKIIIDSKNVYKFYTNRKNFSKELKCLLQLSNTNSYSNHKFRTPKLYNFGDTKKLDKLNTNIKDKYFIQMENFENIGSIFTFKDKNIEKLFKIYDNYRKYFNAIQKNKTSNKLVYPKLNVLFSKFVLRKILFINLFLRIIKYVNNGCKNLYKLPIVRKKYHYLCNKEFKDKILNKINTYVNNINCMPIVLSHGTFREPHIRQLNNGKYGLIDLENCGYNFQNNELIGLLRSNTLLYNYELSEEKFYENINRFSDFFLKKVPDENLFKVTLITKLIGTIYQDYGYLLINKCSLNINTEKGLERLVNLLIRYTK